MKVPEITHLQWLVLQILLDGEQNGEFVRNELAKFGIKKSLPAFYQLMARLEEASFVRGRYEQLVIDGQPVKKRRYRISAPGQRAWESTRDFYMALACEEKGGLANGLR